MGRMLPLVLLTALLSGCMSPSLSGRIATLEERVDLLAEETLTLENRTYALPQGLHALKAAVDVLDRELWS